MQLVELFHESYFNVYPCVPENLKGTLALIISKPIHTLISPIIFHKLQSVVIPGHLISLLLEYHVMIVALMADLQRFFFIA